jgi:crossover junction endodeoxyribonuclease RuvC
MTAPRTIGIDPGIRGGIALLVGDKLEGCWDIPVAGNDINPDELMRILREANADLATIERASSRPGQGVASTFRYGTGYGVLRTGVSACGIPQYLVTAAGWKKFFKLSADKEEARANSGRVLATSTANLTTAAPKQPSSDATAISRSQGDAHGKRHQPESDGQDLRKAWHQCRRRGLG